MPRLASVSLFLLFSVSLLLTSACGNDDVGGCHINSDCAPDEMCVNARCAVSCRENRDCPQGELCSAGRCEAPFTRNCSSDRDCRNGERCLGGICEVARDVTGADASSSSGVVDASSSGTMDTSSGAMDTSSGAMDTSSGAMDTSSGAMDTSSGAMDTSSGAMDTSSGAMDTTEADMGACPPRSGQYGAECDCAAQCATELCVGNPMTGQGTCTQFCITRAECDSGRDACIDAGGGNRVCAPDDTGVGCSANPAANPALDCPTSQGNYNANTDPDPTQCVYQLCVDTVGEDASPTAFCSLYCTSAADCAPNHACSPARCRQDERGAGFTECLLTIGPFLCANREELLAAYPTDARLCVPIGQSTLCLTNDDAKVCPSAVCDDSPALCSGQCLLDNDCPAGGTCFAADVSDPRIPIGICDF